MSLLDCWFRWTLALFFVCTLVIQCTEVKHPFVMLSVLAG